MNIVNGLWFCLGIGVGWGIQKLWQRSTHSVRVANPVNVSAADFVQLREQLQQAELACGLMLEMSQWKGSFLTRISHELRSPLNGLIGMQQLILANLCDNPEEERDFIAQANESALKMVKVLDIVIDAAKVEQGMTRLDLQPVLVAHLLQEVDLLTRLQAQNRNLRLTIVPPETESYVIADPQRLRWVLVSLIDAAIAQMTEGSLTVTVEGSAYADRCTILIGAPVARSNWLENTDHPPTWIDVDSVEHLDQAAIMHLASQPFPQVGLVVLIARSLMQSMEGLLEFAVPANNSPNMMEVLTEIHCTIPWINPEASID